MSGQVELRQRPTFARTYKKLHANQRAAVDAAIAAIVRDPRAGERKRGDLADVWVYKFDCVHQLYLLSYLWDEGSRTLLALGPHENFYRDLKRRTP